MSPSSPTDTSESGLESLIVRQMTGEKPDGDIGSKEVSAIYCQWASNQFAVARIDVGPRVQPSSVRAQPSSRYETTRRTHPIACGWIQVLRQSGSTGVDA